MCHMSQSCVMRHICYLFFYKLLELVGGGSVINGAYTLYFYVYLSMIYPDPRDHGIVENK